MSIMARKTLTPPGSRPRQPGEEKAEGGPDPGPWLAELALQGDNRQQWVIDNPPPPHFFPFPGRDGWMYLVNGALVLDGLTPPAEEEEEVEEEDGTLMDQEPDTAQSASPAQAETDVLPDPAVSALFQFQLGEENSAPDLEDQEGIEPMGVIRRHREQLEEEGKQPGGEAPRTQLARRALWLTLPESFRRRERTDRQMEQLDRAVEAARQRREEEDDTCSGASHRNEESSEVSGETNSTMDEDSTNDERCTRKKE